MLGVYFDILTFIQRHAGTNIIGACSAGTVLLVRLAIFTNNGAKNVRQRIYTVDAMGPRKGGTAGTSTRASTTASEYGGESFESERRPGGAAPLF